MFFSPLSLSLSISLYRSLLSSLLSSLVLFSLFSLAFLCLSLPHLLYCSLSPSDLYSPLSITIFLSLSSPLFLSLKYWFSPTHSLSLMYNCTRVVLIEMCATIHMLEWSMYNHTFKYTVCACVDLSFADIESVFMCKASLLSVYFAAYV